LITSISVPNIFSGFRTKKNTASTASAPVTHSLTIVPVVKDQEEDVNNPYSSYHRPLTRLQIRQMVSGDVYLLSF
jgi:hypothetical protein